MTIRPHSLCEMMRSRVVYEVADLMWRKAF